MATKSTIKNIKKHRCDNCDFECSKLGDWNRHIITSKHINGNNVATENTSNITQYNCDECGKIYNDRSGLWRHKKKCNIIDKEMNKLTKDDDNDEILNNSNLILELLKEKLVFKELILEKPVPAETNDSLIIELLKQNQDFKNLMIEQNKYMMEQSKQMMELAKNAGNTNCNNTNNTTNKFNMQIFLNETCKDAMSITEFVNSLVLTFKDLEDLGRYGYTQGITNIFTRGLQATEVSKRPIHCSDIKRLIIYINDVNGWEKDNSSQEKVIQLIKKIAGKNLRQATEWMRINHSMIHGPDSYEQRQYLKMISQWFGGTDEENVKIYNKIIRNIAPQCYIDKYPSI
jgi:hypothetical protein